MTLLKFDGPPTTQLKLTASCIHEYLCPHKLSQNSGKDKKPLTDLTAHHHQAKVLLFHLSHKNSTPFFPYTLICGFRNSGVNAIGMHVHTAGISL